jgi:hypothetical protein
MGFAGQSVTPNVEDIYFKAIPPWLWAYDGGGIIGATASRRVVIIFHVIDIEAEAGAAKRFGNQQEAEFWGVIYVRYTAFPWNKYFVTTSSASTGLSYATGISEFEKEHF